MSNKKQHLQDSRRSSKILAVQVLGNALSTVFSNSSVTRVWYYSDPKSTQAMKDRWLSVPIFIAIVIAGFTLGILCAVLYFKVLKRKQPMGKDLALF